MLDKNVYLHSDDYAYTLETSKGILECLKAGALDSISIIPNTSYFEESMELFYKEIPNLPYLPKISVHLNLVEGYSSDKNMKVLAKNGILNKSWEEILLLSFTPKRKLLKKELKEEIYSQIEAINEVVEKCMAIAHKNNIPFSQKGIRIDSHTHTHPIPIVWQSLIEVIEENNYNIEYIRNPKELIYPFVKHINLWPTYRLVNFVKNFILNLFSHKIDKYLIKKNLPTMYMWGLIMSGNMNYERMDVLYNDVVCKTKKDNRLLEILVHVGRARKQELKEELNSTNMREFNTSKNRDIEKESILKLSKSNK